jgi:hypothetical protein
MERIEPTRQLAVKVWWAFIWRAFLMVMAAGFVVGLVFGLLGSAVGLSQETMGGISSFLGLVIGVGVSIEVMYRILRKKFKGFEIAVIRAEE